jgi:hypothetical protein
MAANNAQKTYDTLVAGHAKAIGITDLENMTAEQKNQLEHRLIEHGVVKPDSAPALLGSVDIPSAGNEEGAIAPTTKGKAKRTRNQQPAVAAPVSPGDFNPEIMRVFQDMALQGDQVGVLGMQIFTGAVSRRVKQGMVDFTLNATKPIDALERTAESFLDEYLPVTD